MGAREGDAPGEIHHVACVRRLCYMDHCDEEEAGR